MDGYVTKESFEADIARKNDTTQQLETKIENQNDRLIVQESKIESIEMNKNDITEKFTIQVLDVIKDPV